MNRELSFEGLSVGEAQRACVPHLKDANIDDAVLEARMLLGYVLGGGPERVLVDRDEPLSDAQASALYTALMLRCRRVPMSQVLGQREFWSLPFKVTSATLTPRPDSETIVEAALDHVVSQPKSILDLGTGTGCLLMALLSEWKEAQGTGLDASLEALHVAMKNANDLQLAARVVLMQSDWTVEGWDQDLGGPFDVIVSNPPYIPAADIKGLDADVRDYEPRMALDGGESGLDAYRILSARAPHLLKPGGVVVFEVGVGQADDVASLLKEAGLQVLEKRADLGGIERAVVARENG